MMKMVPILTMAVVLGFATPLLAEDKAAGPSGFSDDLRQRRQRGQDGRKRGMPDQENHRRENDLLSERPCAYQAARWPLTAASEVLASGHYTRYKVTRPCTFAGPFVCLYPGLRGLIQWPMSWSSAPNGATRARARSSTGCPSAPTSWCASRAATMPATRWWSTARPTSCRCCPPAWCARASCR